MVAAVFRPGGGDANGVQFGAFHQFCDAVEGGHAIALRGRGSESPVQITNSDQLRPIADLVNTGVCVANVAQSYYCYFQHKAFSSVWSGCSC